MPRHLRAIAALAVFLSFTASETRPAGAGEARGVKVTVLSTMLADTDGIGEWGFAAVVDVNGYRLLFDTGEAPPTASGSGASRRSST